MENLDYMPSELFEQLKNDETINVPKEEREMIADMMLYLLSY